MPTVSVIMPIYNVERFVAEAIDSVLAQTHTDFELLIVDDCSPDRSLAICEAYEDKRIRILRHPENRGLAGARNTGIRAARGRYLAFLDSDDLWHPEKLSRHLAHLALRPQLGVSFSRSAFIDEHSNPMGVYQMPKLNNISPAYYLRRNPIGNGSAPVIRREALDAIAFLDCEPNTPRMCYFDESFRRSEDIECWMRIALTTTWTIEGLPEPLTLYRLNAGGLSASLYQQLESWEQMIRKTQHYAPEFIAEHADAARAYQLRYLARQAIRLRDGPTALKLALEALATDRGVLTQEPGRTLMTLGAATLLSLLPLTTYLRLEGLAQALLGRMQSATIQRQLLGDAN